MGEGTVVESVGYERARVGAGGGGGGRGRADFMRWRSASSSIGCCAAAPAASAFISCTRFWRRKHQALVYACVLPEA